MRSSDILLLQGQRYGDDRGWFQETWSRERFQSLGIHCEFVQDNHSRSSSVGVVRGLHFQAPPYAQAKLVRCVRGAFVDVMVDLRLGAPTYGQAFQVELSEARPDCLVVPPCFAHGFVTLKPDTEIIYKVSAPYAPDYEGGLAWDDPALKIDWPVTPEAAILSPRDQNWPKLAALRSPFSGSEPARLMRIAL